ncbi:MAG: phosphoribosylamine--glycine ligase [Deltaproteobacteria bacterium]|nr:phosphoribosylamine--glycine ligase [Deltaproteobacteria bacterium]
MKKILVVGSGGREHSLVWKLSASSTRSKIYCAPGNAGIARQAECIPVKAEDIAGLTNFARQESVDLTVVGPEIPLTMGIVDSFREHGLLIVGPDSQAAALEGSKVFAKDFMKKYNIPTGDYRVFDSPDEARAYVRKHGTPLTVKADGLAAGKGVFVVMTEEEALTAIETILDRKAFGAAGKRIVVEEFLQGEEASFIVFTDGTTILPMPFSQDHKAVYDGDKGPNTGGMGAYSPAPVGTPEVHEKVMKKIMMPAIEGMATEGRKYQGILYAGLMIINGDPWVLEFNVRFGDPETQPLLMRMKSDLLPVLEAIGNGSLHKTRIEWDAGAAVCVVMASSGYPGRYEKGKIISGLEEAESINDAQVFHAGTARSGGHIVTNGGRVLGVTALGGTIQKAIDHTYKAVAKINWDGVYYRRDIGHKALKQ